MGVEALLPESPVEAFHLGIVSRFARTARSRLEPGQDHAAGRAVKKALKPFRKRILIDELRNRHPASLRQVSWIRKPVLLHLIRGELLGALLGLANVPSEDPRRREWKRAGDALLAEKTK